MCDGPPDRKTMMTALCRFSDGIAPCAFSCRRWGSVSPPKPMAPTFRNARRDRLPAGPDPKNDSMAILESDDRRGGHPNYATTRRGMPELGFEILRRVIQRHICPRPPPPHPGGQTSD